MISRCIYSNFIYYLKAPQGYSLGNLLNINSKLPLCKMGSCLGTLSPFLPFILTNQKFETFQIADEWIPETDWGGCVVHMWGAGGACVFV